jgi:hypothetical protein
MSSERNLGLNLGRSRPALLRDGTVELSDGAHADFEEAVIDRCGMVLGADLALVFAAA